MDLHVKERLPRSWWQIADCVDRYEAASENGVPNLRELVTGLAPECRPAALAELAAVDMEFRWKAGQPRTVEGYLSEYPEILADPACLRALIAQEYRLRSGGADKPTLDEYRARFPDCGVGSLVGNENTLSFNEEPLGPAACDPVVAPGEPAADGPPGHADSGTVRAAGSDTHCQHTEKPKRSSTEPPLEMIGRHIVRAEIGAGAFGRVYRCYDPELKREVAVKLAHPDRTGAAQPDDEFLHEARSAARLRHPGIVSVLDAGKTDDGRGYIVYEYVAGQTLRQRIKSGAYTLEQAVPWCIEIAEALHYAHTHKIVHRDVAPANVIIDGDGHSRLTDFGLARLDGKFCRDDGGRVLGSLAYLSPEQARGDSQWATAQSDVYSLGVILYELLTGRRPLLTDPACDPQEMLGEVQRRVPDPPRTIDDTIPATLEAVCLKAMAKDPSARYATAADMAQSLRAATTPRGMSRRAWLAAAAGFGALSVLLLTMFPPEQTVLPTAPVVSPPPAPVDSLKMLTLQRPGRDMVEGGEPDTVFPLQDGEAVRFEITLAKPGYVYLFDYSPDKTVDLLWPSMESIETQVMVSDLKHPQRVNDEPQWLVLSPNRGHGVEMFLLLVTDVPLSKAQLETLRQVPLQPSDLASRPGRTLINVPAPSPSEKKRGVTEQITERELMFGKTLADSLRTLGLRYYRAKIFQHDSAPGAKGRPR